MNASDLARVVVTLRLYSTPTFSSDVIHRAWAEMIFYALPHGPFRISTLRYSGDGSRLVATVEVAGGWDFTSDPMSSADAFVVAAELERLGFDVASGKIVPVRGKEGA